MLKSHERWILYYEQKLKRYPEDAPQMPLSDIVKDIAARVEKKESFQILREGTCAIRIQDIEIDNQNQIATILINLSDKNVSDPVFANLTSGELRIEPKLDGEGIALSAHMCISLEEQNGLPDVYFCCIESVVGLTRSIIEPFLTHEIKEATSFSFKNEDGRVLKCRPIVDMNVYMSKTLQEDLERGSLLGVELYSNEPVKDFDEDTFVKETRSSILVKTKRLSGEDAFSFIDRMKGYAKSNGFSDIKIRFEEPARGRHKSVWTGSDKEDLRDIVYGKDKLIGVKHSLDQCSEKIHQELATEMKKIVLEARGQKDVPKVAPPI